MEGTLFQVDGICLYVVSDAGKKQTHLCCDYLPEEILLKG